VRLQLRMKRLGSARICRCRHRRHESIARIVAFARGRPDSAIAFASARKRHPLPQQLCL